MLSRCDVTFSGFQPLFPEKQEENIPEYKKIRNFSFVMLRHICALLCDVGIVINPFLFACFREKINVV